jgi:hypothetical protein
VPAIDPNLIEDRQMQVLIFIREWLPSIAIIIGGFWVLFKWVREERLRVSEEQLHRLKEMPALEGSLSANTVRLADAKTIVTIEALWRNRSPLPVPIETQSSRVEAFKIEEDIARGILILENDLGEPIYRYCFLKDLHEYVLEPNTDSRIHTHFLLEPGVYAFRMELYRYPEMYTKNETYSWTKELILDIR